MSFANLARNTATVAMDGAVFAAGFVPSAVGAISTGTKPMQVLVKKMVEDEAKHQIQHQLYEQDYLRTNPPPYMVAIRAESELIRAAYMEYVGDQGEIKKHIIMTEVGERIEKAEKNLANDFGHFFDKSVADKLPNFVRRIDDLEAKAGGHADVNKALVEVNRRVNIIEQTARGNNNLCCKHCEKFEALQVTVKNVRAEVNLVKVDLKAVVQRLWNPKKGEVDIQKMWEFCQWAGPAMENQFKEYDNKLLALKKMAVSAASDAAAATAAAQQAREITCGFDQGAIDALNTTVGGIQQRIAAIETTRLSDHEQRITALESHNPHLQEMWEFCSFLKERMPTLGDDMVAMNEKLGAQGEQIAELQNMAKPENLRKFVEDAVAPAVAAAVASSIQASKATFAEEVKDLKKSAQGLVEGIKESSQAQIKEAVAEAKASFDKDIADIKKSIKDEARAAVAEAAAKKDEEIKAIKESVQSQVREAMAEAKAAFDRELIEIKKSIKDEARAAEASAQVDTKKDEELQNLKAETKKLHQNQQELEKKVDNLEQRLQEQAMKLESQEKKSQDEAKKIEEQGKKIAEQEEQIAAHNRNFEALATEQQEQNDRLARLEQRLQSRGGGDGKNSSTGPEEPQQPPPQGDGAGLMGSAGGDEEMGEAPQQQQHAAPIFNRGPRAAPPQLGPGLAGSIFNQPPSFEDPQVGGGQLSSSGQEGPAGSRTGPAEPESPPAAAAMPTPSIFGNAAAPAPSSIFGNLAGQPSNGNSNTINWGAKLGEFSFADLNQPPAQATAAPEHEMTPAEEPAAAAPGAASSSFPPASSSTPGSEEPGPGPAPAPVAPLFDFNSPPSSLQPTAFPSAMAPQGAFDFSMPGLPPVRAAPVPSSSNLGAGFDRMLINGQLVPVARPGQECNEQGRPMLKPRASKDKAATTASPGQAPAPAAAPGPVPALPSERRLRFQPTVEDEEDVEMGGMSGQPAPVPAIVRRKAPRPVAQPQTQQQPTHRQSQRPQGPVQQPAQQQEQPAQQAVRNTKFSLAFYESWKRYVCTANRDFTEITRQQHRDEKARHKMNQDWHRNLNAKDSDPRLATNELLRCDLRLPVGGRVKGYSRNDMSRLMGVWLTKVFHAAMMETDRKDMRHLGDRYKLLLDETRMWLTSARADVA